MAASERYHSGGIVGVDGRVPVIMSAGHDLPRALVERMALAARLERGNVNITVVNHERI